MATPNRVAIYPGSFDPPTLAHQEILRQAEAVFDRVVVIIGENSEKGGGLLPPHRRLEMWQRLGADAALSPGKCVLNWAEHYGARFVVRGIREAGDVHSEQTYRRFVRQISSYGLEVVYFMPPAEVQHVSSTAVRQIMRLGSPAGLDGWVDPVIAEHLFSKLDLE